MPSVGSDGSSALIGSGRSSEPGGLRLPYLRISILIGPEGGFTPEEVSKATESGFASVSLGPRILRTETAGIAIVSIIGYELGDMGVSGACSKTEQTGEKPL